MYSKFAYHISIIRGFITCRILNQITMIKIKHPVAECNKIQETILSQLPDKYKLHAALMFSYENAHYIFYSQTIFDSKGIYEEWLSFLDNETREKIANAGFNAAKYMQAFAEYTNQRNKISVCEFIMDLMGDEDFVLYHKTVSDIISFNYD